jgi:predicted ATP-binding protein involved in virulence
MRLTRIVVKDLFGIFQHDIPLNLKDRITIMHGPNGYGKTVLLNLIRAIFTSNYSELRQTPFTELILYFDDNSHLKLKKAGDKSNRKDKNPEEQKLIFEYKKGKSKSKTYSPKPINRRDILHSWNMAADVKLSGLERIGPDTFFNSRTGEELSYEELLYHYGKFRESEENEWLKDLKNSLNIRFIETQRLLSFSYLGSKSEYDRRRPTLTPSIISYSEKLSNEIQGKLAEYAALSQSLDRDFPIRLVRSKESPSLDELRNDLKKLEEKRSRLMMAGLLDQEKEINLRELQNIEDNNKIVLSVYIEDVKKKLSVFDELTNKIDLFVNIINKKFRYKKVSISRKQGFIFTTSDQESLSLDKLSSGEQHEVVLLYELLFNTKQNTLILIDEPELSLHVVWQMQFLKDLQEITKLSEFDVLIATHSPQIIHDRWDLTVELKGPRND